MSLTSVPGFRVGHSLVRGGSSGCTVVLGPFRGAVELRGLATGSRELDLLSPFHTVEMVNAILLSGGSAFGLSAADGVVSWLAERGIGFETGIAPVPLVPAAVIFDLEPNKARPGPAEGRSACDAASTEQVSEGAVGAGAGATVGKILGPGGAEPGGVGSASRSWREYRVGALAVVNPLGDVVGPKGEILAGAKTPDGEYLDSDAHLIEEDVRSVFSEAGEAAGGDGPTPVTNTTLVVIGTDAPLSRRELGRIARIASGAFSRAITPVNTPFDGDVLFALSTAPETRHLSGEAVLALGVISRELVEESIRRAVSPENRVSEPNGGSNN